MTARIYKPAKNAMQSGQAKTDRWQLVYAPEIPPARDPLMGYTSSADMKQQLRLSFDTQEEAVAYCQRNGIAYEVYEPQERKPKTMSYSDNFRTGRPQPWTH
jgi:hypothetical protein